jgi:hypothetical protein
MVDSVKHLSKREKADNFHQWAIRFEDEFIKFHDVLSQKFKDYEQLKTLQDSFENLIEILNEDKEKIDSDDLNKKIRAFKVLLNGVEQLVKEKTLNTPLKRAFEQFKSFFCNFLNYLMGAGFPSITAEGGVHLSSSEPSAYTKPRKPVSERTQISRFFLDRLQKEFLDTEKETAPSYKR